MIWIINTIEFFKGKKTYKLKKQACKKNIKNVQMTVLGYVKLQIQCSVDFVIK